MQLWFWLRRAAKHAGRGNRTELNASVDLWGWLVEFPGWSVWGGASPTVVWAVARKSRIATTEEVVSDESFGCGRAVLS